MNKIALITGATSGIGKATALKLAQKGYNLILTGRRRKRLDSLKKELEENHSIKVQILSFDIRNYKETHNAFFSLTAEWQNIDILINNAGLALGLSPIQEGDIEDWDQMIDTNIKGLLYITRIVSPIMVDKKMGHIINISSIAGKDVYPMGNVYCATKHAVTALSQAMRMDLLPYGIKVSLVCPGAVETEFSNVRFKGDDARANSVYEGFDALNADNIADTIVFAIEQPKNVDIQDILVMPTAQARGDMIFKK